MTKPTTKHTDVTIRAQKLFENALDSAVEPKFIRRLKCDAKLLSEIRDILYCIIDCPTLPFIGSPEPIPNPHLDVIDAELEAELNPIEEEPNAAF